MHITVTNVSSSDVNEKLNSFSVHLEEALNRYMVGESFGSIDRFMFVVVAVFEEVKENDFFCVKHNKSGIYTHPVSKERVKYFSIAIPYSPKKILGLSASELRRDLCAQIIHCIDNPKVKIPKGVEYERFAERTKFALAIYEKAEF